MQIKCVVCHQINALPDVPADDALVALCHDCDKQLAGGTKLTPTGALIWSIYDDSTLIKNEYPNIPDAILHYFD